MKNIGLSLLLLIAIFAMGCSGDTGPATTPENPRSEVAVGTSSQLLGMYNVEFDLDNLTAAIAPSRMVNTHYNATALFFLCPDCVQIVVNSFDPATRIIDADVTLKNGYSYTAYDLRLIVYTNDSGPVFTNPCEWTPLFDIPGGMCINPFRKFFKTTPNSVAAPGTSDTQNFDIYVPNPQHYEQFVWAIEASFPGNAQEPYKIKNWLLPDMPSTPGSTVGVSVSVWDWQNDVTQVDISVPEITGEEWTPLSVIGLPTWGTYLVNNMGAAPGVYTVEFRAFSAGSGSLPLYDFTEMTVIP